MQPSLQSVDEVFAPWDKHDSPGCALAVVRDGEIIYKRGYGMANLEYDVPIRPTTIFHVASISKQFTAMAIALLAHDVKLSLDDDVRQHLRELPNFGGTVTIRHLIHHTSGLRDQFGLLRLAGWRMEDVITTEDILDLVRRQQELNFKPGTEILYCNVGYTLLAVIAERATGQPFPKFCAERIFEPLGMRNTHFHDDYTAVVRNRAYSYAPKDDGGFKHVVLSYATVGATSLFTTVEDLALWERNFSTGIVGGKDLIQQMQTPGMLNDGEQIEYAFGLVVGEHKGLKVVQHGGGDAGFRSHLMRFPEQGFSIAILANITSVDPWKLAKQVADIYLVDVFKTKRETEEEPESIELSTEQLADKVGIYFSPTTMTTLRLEMRDRKLILATGAGFDLVPITESCFQVAAVPHVKLKFERTESGNLQMQVLVGKSKPVVYDAVKAVIPTAEELAAYAADYYSPELDISWSITIQNGQLALQRRKYGSGMLLPTFTDGFTGDLLNVGNLSGVTIVFTRSQKSKVDGFTVSTGAVRNLRFLRRDV